MKTAVSAILLAAIVFTASTVCSKRLYVDSYLYGYPLRVYDSSPGGHMQEDGEIDWRNVCCNAGINLDASVIAVMGCRSLIRRLRAILKRSPEKRMTQP